LAIALSIIAGVDKVLLQGSQAQAVRLVRQA